MLKISNKGECIVILLKPKLLHYTKEIAKVIVIIMTGFLLILAMLCIKYKPVYEVTLAGEKLGYVNNLEVFQQMIEQEILSQEETNIANISLINMPTYELKLLSKTQNSNEEEILERLKLDDIVITYKYYEVALNDEVQTYVDTLEEAEQVVNEIKEKYSEDGLELDLQINEKYTEKLEDITIDSLEVAESTVEEVAQQMKEENEALAVINDIKISVLPVNGTITSRYGESSSLRSGAHTGLDIACSTGTYIKVVSGGTVIFAATSGAYGKIVKVDHGNGVQTWYGHCSKIYVQVGEEVEAGDVIAAVGSTGNSTGPHLHFEIRINGSTVNPQNYVY